MKLFRNDYSTLAHPRILEALSRFKDEQNTPYGLDGHSLNAEKRIKEVFKRWGVFYAIMERIVGSMERGRENER